MNPTTLLRVDRLILRNFRCFAECTIELHPQLTVLVAENGRGKTAVLDALGIALGPFVDTVAGTGHFRGFDRADVRLARGQNGAMEPALPTEFVADGYVAGQAIHWSRDLNGYGIKARTTNKEAEDLRQAAKQLRASTEGYVPQADAVRPILPLVAFYGTGRLWSEHRLTEGKRRYVVASDGRMSGYTDCLSSSSSFKGMIAWYENKMNEIGDPRFKTESLNSVSLVRGVQEAVRVMLDPTGWCDLNWDYEKKSLVVEHSTHGRLPLTALSDGVRNMIALIADIARRCASLNPHLSGEAAQLTPGVLLIDEVDMHLHPRWQQQVVELLRKAFPSLQIIVSTHSPHVLSTVNKESIRVIQILDGESTIRTPSLQTRGVMSADVLSSIMGVDPVPQIEEAAWLIQYRGIIEDGGAETPEARALRSILVSHFGESHPLIADCDRLIRFQAFRLKRKGLGEE
jgi:predicted ATP-binding protein involved in virulence